MTLRVNVLGPVTLAVDGRPVVVSAARQRAIAGVLALRVGRTVGLADLITAVWADQEPPNARKVLQTYVARLRKSLPAEAIQSDGDGYRLTGDAEVDAREFEALATDARDEIAAGRHRQAMSLLTRALELWRGDVLEEIDESSWAAGDRLRLRELRRVVQEDLLDAALGAGQHAVVVAEAERAVAEEPLRERRWAQLMLALYRSGRQADALKAYRRCRKVLVEELGVEPGVELRGLEQAILEQSTELAAPTNTAPDTTVGRSMPASLAEALRVPMVGRVAVLARLERSWQAVVDGARCAVVLTGEPGAGKTRLAAALAERALASGAAVLCGRCQPELAVPFQPFAEALEDLAAPTTAARDQYQLFEATARSLARLLQSGPVLLVVEDLHWAMPETLRMLRYIARASELRGLLILGTLRDTEVPITALGELPGLESLTVGPMSVDEVRDLLVERRSDPTAAPRLHELAGGNPFLVEQLVLEERESDVSSERLAGRRGFDVVASRLSKLSPDARSVLELAALSGAEFDLSLLAAAHPAGQEAVLDALDEAESAGLVVSSAGARGRFAFRHAVLRSSLSDSLPASRRMRLHRALATALEADAAFDPARVGVLARHYAEAAPLGLGKQAIDYARQAGEVATAAHAYEEAADYFTLALEAMSFTDSADDALRCDLLTARGRAIRAAGETRSTDLFEAAELARHLDDPERLAAVVLAMAGAAYLLDPYGVNPSLAELAEEAADALHHSPTLRARILAVLATQLMPWIEHDDRRLAVTDEALALARESGAPDVMATVLISRLAGWADPYNVAGRVETALEAVRIAEEVGNLELLCRANHFLSTAQMAAADIEGYTATRGRVRQYVARLHQPSGWVTELLAEAADRFLAGDLDAVERLAAEASTIGIRGGIPEMLAKGLSTAAVGPVKLFQGRAGDLRQEVEFMTALNPRSAWRSVRPLMYLQLGMHEEARADFAELASADFTDIPRRGSWGLLIGMAAQAAVALADRANAAVLIERLTPLTGTVVTYEACHFDLVDRLLGALHLTLGHLEEAKQHLERALDQSRHLGAPLFLARAQADLARLLRATGETQAARELATTAAATADRLGAAAIATEARSVLTS